MAQMTFNAEEATKALNDALANDEELNTLLDDASNKIFEAFDKAGSVVGDQLGNALADAWSEDAGSYFANGLAVQTEYFLREKVVQLIAAQTDYKLNTASTYDKVTKAEDMGDHKGGTSSVYGGNSIKVSSSSGSSIGHHSSGDFSGETIYNPNGSIAAKVKDDGSTTNFGVNGQPSLTLDSNEFITDKYNSGNH